MSVSAADCVMNKVYKNVCFMFPVFVINFFCHVLMFPENHFILASGVSCFLFLFVFF